MKTKRILAILLAVLMLIGSGAAFNASASDDVDSEIAVSITNNVSNNAGYFFAWVTGVFPGNVVEWKLEGPGGSAVNTSHVSVNAAGLTGGTRLRPGTYTITVDVRQGTGTQVNTNTPNICTFYVPNRDALSKVLNEDDTMRLAFLYDPAKWAVYDSVRRSAISAYNDFSTDQETLNRLAVELHAAINDLPLKDLMLSEFLWHIINLFFTLARIIPTSPLYPLPYA